MNTDTNISNEQLTTLVRERVIKGELDTDLEGIIQAVNYRKERLNDRKAFLFKNGQRVRFNSHVRPLYMRGLEATIVKVNRTTVGVKLDSSAGRFGTSVIKCPFNIIDAI